MDLSNREKELLSKLSEIAKQTFDENALKLSVEISIDDSLANYEELKELETKVFYSKMDFIDLQTSRKRPLIVFNDFKKTVKINISTIEEALNI